MFLLTSFQKWKIIKIILNIFLKVMATHHKVFTMTGFVSDSTSKEFLYEFYPETLKVNHTWTKLVKYLKYKIDKK